VKLFHRLSLSNALWAENEIEILSYLEFGILFDIVLYIFSRARKAEEVLKIRNALLFGGIQRRKQKWKKR